MKLSIKIWPNVPCKEKKSLVRPLTSGGINIYNGALDWGGIPDFSF